MPSEYRTDYSYSEHEDYGDSRPPVLDFLEDTGDKVRSTLKNVGDKTRWFLKNKVQTKLNAVRSILPKVPSGYSAPSASYGIPVRSYDDAELEPSYHSETFPSSHNNLQNGFIPTATVKSTYDSDTVSMKNNLSRFKQSSILYLNHYRK